ncbi:MAG: carboxypeptidase-like regulatory domain-containing protein [Flavisolibacter sp.]
MKNGSVTGLVLDENEKPLSGVTITILGQRKSTLSSDSGLFTLRVPADRAFGLLFSYAGYRTSQHNFILNENEEEKIVVRLEPSNNILEEITVTDQRDRSETGLIHPNPKSVINLPAPIIGVESLLKIFVGSNNELTSQYSVRGGSYDENLIYVNDFEVFRPYLVQSGQQEGLSFINPALVHNINFYTGGFQAKYGDKMSSVLDIQYKKPKKNGGSAYVSLLEQGFHLEGVALKKKLTYLIGVRNKNNRSFLSSQETLGSYRPASSDLQALIEYQANAKWQIELLSNISQTKFTLVPQFSQLTTSVFSPFYTSSIGLDTYFEGRETDKYNTGMLGISSIFQVNKQLKLKWMAARFQQDESENRDIAGTYLFGQRNFDKSSASFGLIVNPLGSGLYQNFARDQLQITNSSFSHKGYYYLGQQSFQWSLGYDQTRIRDKINEWQLNDSAGYALPYHPAYLELNNVFHSASYLVIDKLSGFLQDNIALNKAGTTYTFQGGIRFNYNNLNHEILISPRISGSLKPAWKKDVVFRAALGKYDQPPFYRELKRVDGSLNEKLKAQKSWQGVLGLDYNFQGLGKPLRISAEAYYKLMKDVVPYDLENVRIRYFGENSARAYAAGVEARLFGELVKDAESWISIGIMRTQERLNEDQYKTYILDSLQKPTDSVTYHKGWVRRPTDRLLTFGMFFQDYLATNKNAKVYVSAIYGTNLPFNIPGSIQYRNGLTIPAYLRIDLGFSILLLDEDPSRRRSHSPFRNFNNIWAGFEVFNLIDRSNTISYQLIKDFQNNSFALPNRLTPRLINFKIVAKW